MKYLPIASALPLAFAIACGSPTLPPPLDREVFARVSPEELRRLTYVLCEGRGTLACDSTEVAGEKMYLVNSPRYGGELAFRVEGNGYVLYGGRTHTDVPAVAYLPELPPDDRDRLVINFRGYLVPGMRDMVGADEVLPAPPPPPPPPAPLQ